MADSPAAQPLYDALTELNTAQQRWETLADILGAGYNLAYNRHKGALDQVRDAMLAQAQLQYFVLSLLVVSFAGGLPGGLIAPWVVGAGARVGHQILRGMVVTAASNGGSMVRRPAGIDLPASWLLWPDRDLILR